MTSFHADSPALARSPQVASATCSMEAGRCSQWQTFPRPWCSLGLSHTSSQWGSHPAREKQFLFSQFYRYVGGESVGAGKNRVGEKGEVEASSAAELFLSCILTWLLLREQCWFWSGRGDMFSVFPLFIHRALLLIKRGDMPAEGRCFHSFNYTIYHFKESNYKKKGFTLVRALKSWFVWAFTIQKKKATEKILMW